jgi:hypothetical protein
MLPHNCAAWVHQCKPLYWLHVGTQFHSVPGSCRRTKPDYFSVPDDMDTRAGPDPVTATALRLYEHPAQPVEFDLRAMFVLRHNHHTVYFRAGPGMAA